MGFAFSNIQVHTGGRAPEVMHGLVLTAVRSCLEAQGFIEAAKEEDADRSICVGLTGADPWICIYDEAHGGGEDFGALPGFVRTLSTRVDTHVVGFEVSDHVLHMILAQHGLLKDRFVSRPEDVELAPSEGQGDVEQWRPLLAPAKSVVDLRRVWEQENLGFYEGARDVAQTLGMTPWYALADWVDIEGGDYYWDGDVPEGYRFTWLRFRLATLPVYKQRSEEPPAFSFKSGSSWLPLTIGHELRAVGWGAFYASFCNVGRACQGLQVMLWGSALDQELIRPEWVQIVLPHVTYPPPLALPALEVPFTPRADPKRGRVWYADAPQLEIPAGLADLPAASAEQVQKGISWYRYDATIQRTTFLLYLHGKALRLGTGEVYLGAAPLENTEAGLGVWGTKIEVSE